VPRAGDAGGSSIATGSSIAASKAAREDVRRTLLATWGALIDGELREHERDGRACAP